ncbi:AmmeMemoRadiSam system protein B [candidate division KSB1 bacterium]|nr:AmmeMemoRadiSam system protein B [candidate division KSB1 bacterium]
MSTVRKATWAGQFYPANARALESKIDGFLHQASKEYTGEKIYGLIVPHAGYDYSGQTAAAAFALLKERDFKTVILLAPSHSEFISGASLYSGDYYETPIGLVPVDKALSERLVQASPALSFSSKGHDTTAQRPEHSLEVQLPFLQRVLNENFRIVPIIVQDYRPENCRQIGDAIAGSIDQDQTLLLASSDLYHGESCRECKRQDKATVNSLLSLDPEEFIKGANKNIYQACGAGPAAILLFASKRLGADDVQLIDQTTSADVTGVQSGYVVGYASLVVGKQ